MNTSYTNALDKLSPSRVLLAPMVGITHFAVRQALSEFLPLGMKSLWPTEMLSSRRLPYEKKRQTSELFFDDAENGLAPQLLGNEEIYIRESIFKLMDWGASSIDINMGCPVRKALRHNYGVALMGDPDYAAEVTSMAVRHARVPVSVKLRAGFQKDEDFILKFAKRIESAGASWITIHPRTADQKRRGSADWAQIKKLKSELSIPVLGNGDVQCYDDVLAMQKETGCDRVMIGRALLAKPWMLWNEPSAKAMEQDTQTQAQIYGKFLLRVIELARLYPDPEDTLKKIRFLVYHSSSYLEFGHFLYKSLMGLRCLDDFSSFIANFFSEPRVMFKRTELRH